MRAFSRQTIRVSNSSKFFFVKLSLPLRIIVLLQESFPFFLFRCACHAITSFFYHASRSLTGCQRYTTRGRRSCGWEDWCETIASLSRVLLVGWHRAFLQDFASKWRYGSSFVIVPFQLLNLSFENLDLDYLTRVFYSFPFFFVRTLQRKSRNSNENIVGFQRNHGILASNDFDGRNRSETMVRRYDKRSIVRNAIDPRQTVTVTRDALRNPMQLHVWLRTNTRVKINADTRALHDPCRSSTERYPRSDYIHIHISLSASHLLFSMIIFGNRIWTQNKNFNISHPDRGIL